MHAHDFISMHHIHTSLAGAKTIKFSVDGFRAAHQGHTDTIQPSRLHGSLHRMRGGMIPAHGVHGDTQSHSGAGVSPARPG